MSNEENEKTIKTALQAAEKNNFEESVLLTRQAAFNGDGRAMYVLAMCYREGRGVPESLRHAEYWLRMGVAHGNVSSITSLASLRSMSGPVDDPQYEARMILSRAYLKGQITRETREEVLEKIETVIEKDKRRMIKQIRYRIESAPGPA